MIINFSLFKFAILFVQKYKRKKEIQNLISIPIHFFLCTSFLNELELDIVVHTYLSPCSFFYLKPNFT